MPDALTRAAAAARVVWPVKTREHEHLLSNSAHWNDFEFRDDDIVIATYSKSGTTLTQQIVAQLVFDGDPEVFGLALSPWVEFGARTDEIERMLAVTHRRFLKTHLPLDALNYSPRAKYIAVGRDPRDVIWSLHNHMAGFRREHLVEELGDAAPPPVTSDPREFYHLFLDGSNLFQPYWPHIRSWWNFRHLPNLLTLHYANLVADLPGQVRRIAAFLDIPLDERRLPLMVEHCSIAHMRKVGAQNADLNRGFERGAETFINKGTNGRWRDVLTQAEIDKCDQIAARELTHDCAAWLRDGTMA